MPGQPLKSNQINFILRGHSHNVDPALKQRCAIVTWESQTVDIYCDLMNHSMGSDIILANLVDSQGLVNIQYKAHLSISLKNTPMFLARNRAAYYYYPLCDPIACTGSV